MATNAPVQRRPESPPRVVPNANAGRNDASRRAAPTRRDWKETARQMWLWPVAILLSFPIGGYIADVVINGVDSVATAIAVEFENTALSLRTASMPERST